MISSLGGNKDFLTSTLAAPAGRFASSKSDTQVETKLDSTSDAKALSKSDSFKNVMARLKKASAQADSKGDSDESSKKVTISSDKSEKSSVDRRTGSAERKPVKSDINRLERNGRDLEDEISNTEEEKEMNASAQNGAANITPEKKSRPANIDELNARFFLQDQMLTKKGQAAGGEISSQVATQNDQQPAVNYFLKSMKEELGIPRSEIVQAMSDLSRQDLMKSPDQNMSKILSKLDLSPSEQSRAETLYSNLVSDLKTQETKMFLPDYLMPEPNTNTVILDNKRSLNDKIDKLNQSFFLRGKDGELRPTESEIKGRNVEGASESDTNKNLAAAEFFSSASAKKSSAAAATRTGTGTASGSATGVIGKAMGLTAAGAAVSSGGVDSAALSNAAPNTIPTGEITNLESFKANSSGALSMSDSMSTESFLNTLSDLKQKVDPDTAIDDEITLAEGDESLLDSLGQKESQKEIKSRSMASSNNGGFQNTPGDEKAINQMPVSKLSGDETNSSFQNSLISKKQNANLSNGKNSNVGAKNISKTSLASSEPGIINGAQWETTLQNNANKVDTAPMSGAFAGRLDAEETQSRNLDNILNQSQSLVQKGGGEMTIKLHPEGVGEVQLKVAVKDGKVNVDMMTDSPEAKKLLETSLSDLRNGLEAHKLQIDSLKVDVTDKSSQQFQSQSDQSREMARQFLSDFRDQNQNFRQGFFEPGQFRVYANSNKSSDDLQSDVIKNANHRSRSRDSSRRIDLVA